MQMIILSIIFISAWLITKLFMSKRGTGSDSASTDEGEVGRRIQMVTKGMFVVVSETTEFLKTPQFCSSI